MDNKKLVRIGIIGVGGIARGVHIPGIKASAHGKITAICDINEKTLYEVADELGLSKDRCFTDYRGLLSCDDIDAVEICTPNHLHVQIAADALNAGKAVNIEKPISCSCDDVHILKEAFLKNPMPNMMCFSYRFRAAVRYAKHLIDSGVLGNIVSINVEYLKSSAFWEGRRLDWRFVKEYSGTGVIGDLGVHLIDMTRYLVGDIKSVCGRKATVVKKRQLLDSDEWADVTTDDYCNFLAETVNGVSATFVITRCAIGHANTIKYEIFGEKGVISFDLNNPDILYVCYNVSDIRSASLQKVDVPPEFRASQEQTFIDLCLGNITEAVAGIDEGIKCQKIIDAIDKSCETRSWVDID